jgi:CIC family chloride channel protein
MDSGGGGGGAARGGPRRGPPWNTLGAMARIDPHPAAVYRAEGAIDRARAWLAGGEGGLVLLALVIGAAAGFGAIAFRELILGLTELFTGHRDYSAIGRVGNPQLGLGMWFVVGVPVVGGLLYGPLIARFAPEARGHGVPEVMLAVAHHGGRIRPQVPLVKALASALCIGSGGSVGREGPIVQIGSAIGSLVGQVGRVSEERLRLLVACGAAGGVAATFNAPIAGVFFALEVILRNFESRSFGFVVLSSVTADAISRAVFGSSSFLRLPTFHQGSPAEYLLYILLGALAGVVGVAFVRVLYGGEDLADRLWHGPEWLRPAVGGVLLGLLLLAVPEMYGVGYPVLEKAVSGDYATAFLVGLLAAKILATTLTISIGGSGGVFAPSLFMGAMLGSAYGSGVHSLLPSLAAAPGAYGLVGMAAVFAAAARAPITAVLIIFELTGDYSIILPLMLATALATGVAHRLAGADTIYTLKLRRRGIDISREVRDDAMQKATVGEAMRPMPAGASPDLSLGAALSRLADGGGEIGLAVVDARGSLLGVLSAADLAPSLVDLDQDTPIGRLAHEAPELHADETLAAAVSAFARTDDPGLPVLAAGGAREVVGWLTHADLLGAYHRALTVPPGG